MGTEIERQIRSMDLFRKGMRILLESRLKEISRIKSAIKVQDCIRSKIGEWHGSKEIRRWREAR